MIILTSSKVSIQTSEQSVPRVPGWFREVTVIAQYLGHLGVLADISERVRFARRRFGHYDLIDFVVVLLGYAISGERALEAFKEEPMTSEVNKNNDETAIKRVIEEYVEAFRAKDLDGVMSIYAVLATWYIRSRNRQRVLSPPADLFLSSGTQPTME
jgi:hypothetical protein